MDTSMFQSMVHMATAEYRELVENRMLYKLAAEKLERENNDLTIEVKSLQELLRQTQNELDETKAENKELANGLSHWYAEYKRLTGEKTDADDQIEPKGEILSAIYKPAIVIQKRAESEEEVSPLDT